MDNIILKDIRFHGFHGVPAEERQVGGHYEVDAILNYSLTDAGNTDIIDHTIDYAKVVDLITEIGTQNSFKLIEALAERIATEIIKQFPVESVKIKVKKLHPPIKQPITYFAVEICRIRE
ncbi:dihydroneopterin aldolase [Candidatus Poribacteria bacterium]|nr:dihydroneopterin aldolase [Candidatus Poribacteria bacterium]